MAFSFGQFNEFSDSVTFADPVVEAVAKAIQLGPFTGKFYEAMGAPAVSLTQKEFKIYSRSKTSRDGVTAGEWGAAATTGLAINADTLKGLTIGHVLEIDGEVVVISAIDRSAGTVSVYRRGDGGTTAKTHESGAAFEVIGFAGSDDDLKHVESVNETTREWSNYVQTIFETIDWTKHATLTRQGLDSGNAVVVLVREAEIRVAELLARMSIRGVKAKVSEQGNGRFMSAGLIAQLADATRGGAVYNVNGELTEQKFKDALKQRFDAGATMNTIWCSPTAKGWINAFLGANSAISLNQSAAEHTAGGVYVDAYNYEGAILRVRVDADIPDSKIAVVNQGKCKKGWLADDGLRLVDEPSLSSREKRKSLQGSVGFLIEDVGADHLLLDGITGGPAERVYKVQNVGA